MEMGPALLALHLDPDFPKVQGGGGLELEFAGRPIFLEHFSTFKGPNLISRHEM